MTTTILILISLLLFALWNGLVIKWKLSGDQKYSRYWHIVAFLVKLPLVAVVFIASDWYFALVAGFVCWIPYNVIIALVIGQRWYYVGKTAWFDIQIRKLLPFIKFDK